MVIRFVDLERGLRLQDYQIDLYLAPLVAQLRQTAQAYLRSDGRTTVWVVNSTEHGGGVAEMLPSQLGLMRDLGIDARWVVIEPDEPAFFDLTKRLHNALHGKGRPNISADDRALYDRVSRQTADALAPHIKPNDLLIVHDPQPAGMGALLRRELPIRAIWRCHIGLDEKTESTEAAWDFLSGHVQDYDRAVFSLPEYVPTCLASKAAIIPPAIDPLSHKNRELPVHKIAGILVNANLAETQHPVVCENFDTPAMRLSASGEFEPATVAGDLGLMFRPIVTQISRWDRLKGFAPLLEAFTHLKRNGRASMHPDREPPLRSSQRLEQARLVLAGPEPASVADDPEAKEVLAELCGRYLELPAEVQQDVALLSLPMKSRKENALIVNALQCCSTIVVQNSLREGFGLTATEAMAKGKYVLGTHAAGLRAQIEDGVHGGLIRDPQNPEEIAEALRTALGHPLLRNELGRNARRRVGERYLTPSQVRVWIQLIAEVTTGIRPPSVPPPM